MSRIDEFRSPDFHGWAERCFGVILVLVLIAFAGDRLSSSRPPGNRKLRLSQLLVVLLAAYAGFYSSRNLPVSSMLLVLVAGPMLWENFAALADKPGAWRWLRNGAAGISEFSDRMGAQEMRASRAPVAGCLGGLCIRDLSSRRMAGLAAVDSCAI